MLESLFDKFAGLNACNFIKKRHQHVCFANNYLEFLRTSFFIEHLRWLLLSTSRNIVEVIGIYIDSSRLETHLYIGKHLKWSFFRK